MKKIVTIIIFLISVQSFANGGGQDGNLGTGKRSSTETKDSSGSSIGGADGN